MNCDEAVDKRIFEHHTRVEAWISGHLTKHGVTMRDIKTRCMLRQGVGICTLLIDGVEVDSIPDMVMP